MPPWALPPISIGVMEDGMPASLWVGQVVGMYPGVGVSAAGLPRTSSTTLMGELRDPIRWPTASA